jgi:hypothetical protein
MSATQMSHSSTRGGNKKGCHYSHDKSIEVDVYNGTWMYKVDWRKIDDDGFVDFSFFSRHKKENPYE